MKGFALRLVLKQRHKRTRKWPIERLILYLLTGLNSYLGLFAPCKFLFDLHINMIDKLRLSIHSFRSFSYSLPSQQDCVFPVVFVTN